MDCLLMAWKPGLKRLAALSFLTVATAIAASALAAPVGARLVAESDTIKAAEPFWIALVLDVEPGWHIYGREPGDTGLPTQLEWELPSGFEAEAPVFPATKRYESDGIVSFGMEGQVVILTRIRPPKSLGHDPRFTLHAGATWLACKESCIPGKAKLELSLLAYDGKGAGERQTGLSANAGDKGLFPAARAAAGIPETMDTASPSSGKGLVLALFLAFLGGIILNLMPCVLPVLSLKITGLMRRAGESGKEGLAQGLAYGAGIIGAFEGLAIVIIIMKAGGQSVGWGFQFRNPSVIALTAALFFMVALNLFGLFDVGFRIAGLAGSASAKGSKGGGRLASFAEGFLATFAATPCTAPFMGAALGWALAQSAPVTLAVFASLGLGMALPFVLLSAKPALFTRLPPPGRWMESLRIAMGFPMAATALWLAHILGRLSGGDAVSRLYAGLLACAIGAWILGRWGHIAAPRKWRGLAVIAAGAFILGGAAFGAIPPRGGGGEKAELAGAGNGGSSKEQEGSLAKAADDWEAWTPARFAQLRAEGKPVFIAFTAEWCLSCKVNESAVLDREGVKASFRKAGVVRLLADWTAPNPDIEKFLAENGRAGVPFYLLYGQAGKPARVLPEILTQAIVENALNSLP